MYYTNPSLYPDTSWVIVRVRHWVLVASALGYRIAMESNGEMALDSDCL